MPGVISPSLSGRQKDNEHKVSGRIKMRVFTSEIGALLAKVMLLTAATMVFAVSGIAQAQATAADLSGTVLDQTGAVVAGATVQAKNTGTGISRTATSGAEGNYQMIGLPPGEYEISTEAASFKKSVISGIRLTVGQSADLTIKLEVGAASAEVNVSSEEVQL